MHLLYSLACCFCAKDESREDKNVMHFDKYKHINISHKSINTLCWKTTSKYSKEGSEGEAEGGGEKPFYLLSHIF